MVVSGKNRIAVIDYDNCNFDKCGNYLCEKVCPVNRTGKKCITHEEGMKPTISEELCIGCEICQNKCPYKAISIVNIGFDLKEPLHSFGKNQFRMYGLALPKEKTVIGLLGRNGIGKTTLINILSGTTVPNFGEKDLSEKQKEVLQKSKKTVLDYYKGKEAQAFFKKLYAGKISIALKPQNLEGLSVKEKVINLFKKIGTEERIKEVTEKLNIEELLEKNANELSGGEFQKVAIAATGIKDAELYFFDEPSSFLDIKERLRVAKFIQELGKEKSVIVIEHDLVLLDYLAEFIHLMYGKPGTFGFISTIKGIREGINTYLEGYSQDENYRFRANKIDFFAHGTTEKKPSTAQLMKWPTFEKTLGKFTLSVEENEIKRNQVVGIIGPNGIGKTTFMRVLAGEIKPENGELTSYAKISYKPQYINYSGEKIVRDLFEGSIDEIKMNIIKPMEIEQLLEKKAKHLSGGELQRVSIALCLSKKADVYLMDEPSAYLDVEQRMNVAKIIKNQMMEKECSALIIDHDLSFLDYLSDRLIVFKGEPGVKGEAKGPYSTEQGMNELLSYLEITLRRDKDSKRPRINKFDSVLDREQKKSGKYYYN